MQYLLMIYEDEALGRTRSPEDMGEILAGFRAFGELLDAEGAMVAGDALDSVETATTVRVRDGQVLHTDGPFAETKEQLGGYYLIEAPDLDTALRYAAEIPTATSGSIEVRPIFDWSTMNP
jgi:hypothetical protein